MEDSELFSQSDTTDAYYNEINDGDIGSTNTPPGNNDLSFMGIEYLRNKHQFSHIDISDLSTNFLQDFFAFFLMSKHRVAVEAKTCNDLFTFTSLIKEKERDLEIVSFVGQKLLEENNRLKQSNQDLNSISVELTSDIHELKQEIEKKDEIMELICNDKDVAGKRNRGGKSTPKPTSSKKQTSSAETKMCSKIIEKLQEKIDILESDNLKLKQMTEECLRETEDLEIKESILIEEFHNLMDQMKTDSEKVREELNSTAHELQRQEEEKGKILGELVDLHKKYKTLQFNYESLVTDIQYIHQQPDHSIREFIENLIQKYQTNSFGNDRYWRRNNNYQYNNRRNSSSNNNNRNYQNRNYRGGNSNQRNSYLQGSQENVRGPPGFQSQKDFAPNSEHSSGVEVKNPRENERTEQRPASTNDNRTDVSYNRRPSFLTDKHGTNTATSPMESDPIGGKTATYAQILTRHTSMEDMSHARNALAEKTGVVVKLELSSDGNNTLNSNKSNPLNARYMGGPLTGNMDLLNNSMPAGSTRTWRRRRQQQEYYYNQTNDNTGHSYAQNSEPYEDMSPSGTPYNHNSFNRGGLGRGAAMKRFNSNVSLNMENNSGVKHNNDSQMRRNKTRTFSQSRRKENQFGSQGEQLCKENARIEKSFDQHCNRDKMEFQSEKPLNKFASLNSLNV